MATKENPTLTAGDIMTKDLVGVTPTSTLKNATSAMSIAGIRHLVVVDDDVLVGVISQRDVLAYIAREFSRGVNPAVGSVSKFMISPVVTGTADALVTEVANMMIERQIGCVPIVNDKGQAIGIITRSDVIRNVVLLNEFAPLLA